MLFDLFSSAKFTCHILCIYKFEVIIIAQQIYLPGVENSEKDEHKPFAGNIAAKLFSRLASASYWWFVKGFFLISILLRAFSFSECASCYSSSIFARAQIRVGRQQH